MPSRTLASPPCRRARPAAVIVPRLEWESRTAASPRGCAALSAVSRTVAWASGANGTVLRTVDGGVTWQPRSVAGAATLDFRDVDAMSDARRLRAQHRPRRSVAHLQDDRRRRALGRCSSQNKDPRSSSTRWPSADADQGVAFSDSVAGAFVILTTANGGRDVDATASGDRCRAALPGEGAFAASGTNVAVSGTRACWIAHRRQPGASFGRRRTHVDCRRDAGSDQASRPGSSQSPSAIANTASSSAATTATKPRPSTTPRSPPTAARPGAPRTRGLSGYRSVVAWVPTTTSAYVAAGPSGVDWSADDGRTWTSVPGDGFDTVSFAPRTRAGWGAGDRWPAWQSSLIHD